jgi:hypothetical protein
MPQCPFQRRLHLHPAELFNDEVQGLQGFLFLVRVYKVKDSFSFTYLVFT